jgi:hypothetical protein
MDGNQSLDKCDPLLPPRLPIGVTLSKNALKPFSSFQFLIGGLGGRPAEKQFGRGYPLRLKPSQLSP